MASLTDTKTAAVTIPDWVIFPEKDWLPISPGDAGLDVPAWNAWLAERNKATGPNLLLEPGDQHGMVITRGGRLLAEVGNGRALYHSASVGKAFVSIALQLAIEDGAIRSEHDAVREYWTGTEGPPSEQLDSPHKYLTAGHNAAVTFHHLWTMRAGFPGYYHGIWKQGREQHRAEAKEWEGWPEAHCATGDLSFITAATYSHISPGQDVRYSSAGIWRLSQALTRILRCELKDYLDERLSRRIGISADAWRWITGRQIHEDFGIHPQAPGYGKYIDPPYEIQGKRVQGSGGWVVMSPKDLARVGLLVATRGIWKGQRLIQDVPLLRGHGGFGGSRMMGWGRFEDSDLYISLGAVGTQDVAGIKTDPDVYKTFIKGPVSLP